MKVSFLLLSFTLALALGACQTVSTETGRYESEPKAEEAAPADEQEALESEGTESASEGTAYVNFSQESYDSLLGEKPFALFFHASWCPTCQLMEKDILSKIGEFPEGAIILKADYDLEIALKEKYGITSQSLVVILNADGTVSETLAAPSADTLISRFNTLLN